MATELTSTRKLHKDIPGSVPVGIMTFSIEPWNMPLTDDEDTWGDVSFEEQTIRVNQNLARGMQVMTLWHELFHVFLEVTGLSDVVSEKVEESLCCGFGYFMADLEDKGFYKLRDPEVK